mgnify:FL=1|tara:strand:- start:55 stop:336 length:282 start_codon:yes stop_codon:yes gene_type:complete
MLKFISFLIPTIKLNFDNFNSFYDSLQEETVEIIESMESNYLLGLLNYSYDGCLDELDAEQLLEEHGFFLDQYVKQTNDNDLTILGLVDFLGY